MSSKELTAKVRLDISAAERAIAKLSGLIAGLNKSIGGKANQSIEASLSKQAIEVEKLKKATIQRQIEEQKLAQAEMRSSEMKETALARQAIAAEKLTQATVQRQKEEAKLLQTQQQSQAMSTAATQKEAIAAEKLLQAQMRSQAMRDAAAQKAANQQAREEAAIDRQIQKELDAVTKRQQVKWKAFQQEQIAYEKKMQQEAALAQKALATEKARQQSLKTLGAGDKAAQRILATTQRLEREEYERWWQNKLINQEFAKSHPLLDKILTKLKLSRTEAINFGKAMGDVLNTVNNRTRLTSRILGGVWDKVKGIIGTYMGVMGTRAVLETTDILMGAESRINYVAAENLGDAGYNSDGSYSTKTLDITQDAMDKMYVASQNARTSYQTMMDNVSKNMLMAGDAFDNNIDNAIRFQEIMAEAYVVSGASAQQMSSSMYQLTQALGSGVLQGDELKSVSEGAQIAYKQIEEFVQGVYNTEESLKELGSQGKVTSDMVVAAILSGGSKIDKSFAQTSQTFAQTFDQIKNAALRAFIPVMEFMRNMLQRAIDTGMIEKFEAFFTNAAKAVMIFFTALEKAVIWITDNWDWLKHVIVGVFMTMITWSVISTGISIANAIINKMVWYRNLTDIEKKAWVTFFRVAAATAIVILAVLALVYVFYLWKTGAIDTCQAIVLALAVVGVALLILGTIFNITWMLWTAGVLLAIAAFIYFFSYICGIGWAIFTFLWNLGQSILNIASGVLVVIGALIANFIIGVFNHLAALWNWLKAFCTNVGILWENMCNGLKSWFWNAIADMLEGCEWLVNALNKIAEFFGKDGISIEGIRAKADDYSGKNKELVDMTDAWNAGMKTYDYADIGEVWDKYSNIFGTGLSDYDPNEAFNTGYNFGEGIKNKINEWVSQFQNSSEDDEAKDKLSLLDELGKKLGLDFSGMGQFPTEGATGSDPSSLLGSDPTNLLKDIAGDTDAISDSMELSQDDMEYLRKIAEMEWKKEYTTANITIDMTNNNTVNGESDLFGIVTKLSDMLYEELDYLANGVYA